MEVGRFWPVLAGIGGLKRAKTGPAGPFRLVEVGLKLAEVGLKLVEVGKFQEKQGKFLKSQIP